MVNYIILGIIITLFILIIAFKIKRKILRRKNMSSGCGGSCGSCSGCH